MKSRKNPSLAALTVVAFASALASACPVGPVHVAGGLTGLVAALAALLLAWRSGAWR
jgi:hypothetical protein